MKSMIYKSHMFQTVSLCVWSTGQQ